MPFPNKETQFKPGESGNPAGKPKGAKSLSTHIREMMADEEFEVKLESGELIKEMPIKAIIKVAVSKSLNGDTRAMDWLAKYGWGTKIDLALGSGFTEIYEMLKGISNDGNGLQDDSEEVDESPETNTPPNSEPIQG